MAGPYWHFLAANNLFEKIELLSSKSQELTTILENKKSFLAAVQGPDYYFYPGGSTDISILSHKPWPADIGRALLEHAKTPEEISFALGWLMHLATDQVTHPYVNEMITEHFPAKCKNGTNPELYPLGHHRVEWGIDVFLLQHVPTKDTLPELKDVLPTALERHTLAEKAFAQVYKRTVDAQEWKQVIKGMINYGALFKKVWKITGRIRDSRSVLQGAKSFLYYSALMPIAKAAAIRTPNNGAGVVIPITPTAENMETVQVLSDEASDWFLTLYANQFEQMENHVGE